MSSHSRGAGDAVKSWVIDDELTAMAMGQPVPAPKCGGGGKREEAASRRATTVTGTEPRLDLAREKMVFI